MAIHKVFWCIFLISRLTDARSVLDSSVSSAEHESSSRYRFDDDYLTPEATHDSSRKQEINENCEKVMKNSMLCMVCKDTESNAKYERCSYVSEPSAESFNYAKSKVKEAPEYESSQSRLSKLRSASSTDEEDDRGSRKTDKSRRNPENQYQASSEYISESERVTKKADKEKCREEERDGMNCMVCVDPDTGGNFEKCSYAYEPNDKVYKFSKSNRYGYPEERSSAKTTKSPRRSDDDEDIDSEETKQIEKKENDNCREEIRDSMTCTVCKNPKTGGNSEQCSYSYKPNDKMYAYSQSRSFGSPNSQDH